MIESFGHKGLKELFTAGKTSKLPQAYLDKINKILTVINAANDIQDLRIPAFRLHQLKAPPYKGYWSIDVSGNYRIIFQFHQGKVSDVNYLDTH